MAGELLGRTPQLLEANEKDVSGAAEHRLSTAAIDRLRLTESRIAGMAEDIRQVAELADPVGRSISEWTRPNGLRISKVRTPIGVIGIIYESRPNVTSDAAVLCIKTGNAVILRGGSESLNSNLAIAGALQAGAQPKACRRMRFSSFQQGSGRGSLDGRHESIYRSHYPAWRSFPHRNRCRTRPHARDQTLSWRVPRVCGR